MQKAITANNGVTKQLASNGWQPGTWAPTVLINEAVSALQSQANQLNSYISNQAVQEADPITTTVPTTTTTVPRATTTMLSSTTTTVPRTTTSTRSPTSTASTTTTTAPPATVPTSTTVAKSGVISPVTFTATKEQSGTFDYTLITANNLAANSSYVFSYGTNVGVTSAADGTATVGIAGWSGNVSLYAGRFPSGTPLASFRWDLNTVDTTSTTTIPPITIPKSTVASDTTEPQPSVPKQQVTSTTVPITTTSQSAPISNSTTLPQSETTTTAASADTSDQSNTPSSSTTASSTTSTTDSENTAQILSISGGIINTNNGYNQVMGIPLTPQGPVIATLYAADPQSGSNTGKAIYEIWNNGIITDMSGTPLTGANNYVYVYIQPKGGTEYSVHAYG